MVRLVMTGILAVLLFAGGLGISLFMNKSLLAPPEEPATVEPEPLPLSELPARPQFEVNDAPVELPMAIHEEPMTPEEVVRYGAIIRSHQETIKKEEADLRREQSRAKLIYGDVEAKQKEIEGMLSKLVEAMKESERILQVMKADLETINTEKQQLETSKQQLETTVDQTQTTPAENIKQISDWFQNMDPQNAAQYVKAMCDSGKLEDVVNLMGYLEPKKAAGILAAIPDANLQSQLLTAFQETRRDKKKK
ncbi:MAG: hypothetical protein R3C28_08665 [Pirellulaceae bacterium]